MLADITFGEATVRWSGFKIGTCEPDEREYVFERAAYDAAIKGIASLSEIAVRQKV